MTCPKCEVCKGNSHHWMWQANEERQMGFYECKHCDAEGVECIECDGTGGDEQHYCPECDGEGVYQVRFMENHAQGNHRMNVVREGDKTTATVEDPRLINTAHIQRVGDELLRLAEESDCETLIVDLRKIEFISSLMIARSWYALRISSSPSGAKLTTVRS